MRLFVSGSMGATVSLNAMTHGVESPACWYGVKPAVDPTKMQDVPGAKRIIAKAYGGEPVPADRNPAKNVDKFPTDTRYRFVASPQRPVGALRGEHRSRWLEASTQRGAEVSMLEVIGDHDDPSHFNVARPGRLRRHLRVAEPERAGSARGATPSTGTGRRSTRIATRAGFARGCR